MAWVTTTCGLRRARLTNDHQALRRPTSARFPASAVFRRQRDHLFDFGQQLAVLRHRDEGPVLLWKTHLILGVERGHPDDAAQPPFISTMRSTAAGFTPPTERFSSMPPNISMPGTSLRTRYASDAVGS